MNYFKYNILELFDSSQKSYIIPYYQHGYYLKEEIYTAFIDRLIECKQDNNAHYGYILLNTIKKGILYEIIDGRQRITAITILIKSILNILKSRENESLLEDFDFQVKESIYIKNGEKIKFRSISHDISFNDSLTINNKTANTLPFQKSILKAKKYFSKKLNKLSTIEILNLLTKIEKIDIDVIEVVEQN